MAEIFQKKWKNQKSEKHKFFVFQSTSYLEIYRKIETFGIEFYTFYATFFSSFFQLLKFPYKSLYFGHLFYAYVLFSNNHKIWTTKS